MGNLTLGLKKFLANKNTVTVVCVVAAILVLYLGYNARVNAAVNPIEVPYARETIKPGVQITQDMVGTKKVPPAMLEEDQITSASEVIDKYSNADSIIPAGSLFHRRSVVEKEQLPASIILDYPKGYTLYNLPVNIQKTYGNSIFPGNYIDIYVRITKKVADGQTATDDQIMYGKLMENVKVLAVKDSDGNAVFADLDEKTTPSMVIFALPQEYYVLLKKADYLGTYDSEIVPVPTSESLKTKPGDVKITNDDIKDFINQVTVWTEDR